MADQQQQQQQHSFATCYMELCRQQRLRPLPMICVTLPHSLDFTTDRVKMDDWAPILNSLSLDRTLRSISVRSKYQYRKLLEHATTESKARAVGKAPVVLTRFIVEWLSHSLGQCVRNSTTLTSLELEGIPIPSDCLAVLCVGLAGTKCLRHLSLQRCYIGDAGCELLCRSLTDAPSVRTLNLSQCDLTSAAGAALAAALCRQRLELYQDAWKQSLRYREPKLESMPGLRRLTLNGNAKLGNEAVTGIIEAIRDSLWFKALDLQQCGLSESVAQEILQLLEHNKTLLIVDVRLNPGLQETTLNEISRRLECNDLQSGGKGEYRWLSLPQPKESANKRVSSAGSLHKEAGRTSSGTTMRPKSAMVRQVKRPPAPIVYKKPLLMPAPQLAKRMKTKPPLPVFERRPRQPMKPPDQARVAVTQVESPPVPPKISLHLDLQSQIQSVSDTSQCEDPPPPEDKALMETEPIREQDVTPQKHQDMVRELLELREDRDRLLEESRSRELILAEERARREFAEAKLRSAKCDLTELEEVVRQRDRDSRGYLLVSQKSLEEICRSFARLLDMLESSSVRSENDSIGLEISDGVEEQELVKENIKRRFALIIRKTKSENLKRGLYSVDDDTRLQLTARYGRSEGNIRNRKAIEPVMEPVRVERHIGDTAENSVLRMPRDDVRLPLEKAGGESPGERARAIFASIVNGNARLGFGHNAR